MYPACACVCVCVLVYTRVVNCIYIYINGGARRPLLSSSFSVADFFLFLLLLFRRRRGGRGAVGAAAVRRRPAHPPLSPTRPRGRACAGRVALLPHARATRPLPHVEVPVRVSPVEPLAAHLLAARAAVNKKQNKKGKYTTLFLSLSLLLSAPPRRPFPRRCLVGVRALRCEQQAAAEHGKGRHVTKTGGGRERDSM